MKSPNQTEFIHGTCTWLCKSKIMMRIFAGDAKLLSWFLEHAENEFEGHTCRLLSMAQLIGYSHA